MFIKFMDHVIVSNPILQWPQVYAMSPCKETKVTAFSYHSNEIEELLYYFI